VADLRIALDAFDGPLDLLLHLVQQAEVDIQELPLAQIADQFVRHVEQGLSTLDVDRAGERTDRRADAYAARRQSGARRVRVTRNEHIERAHRIRIRGRLRGRVERHDAPAEGGHRPDREGTSRRVDVRRHGASQHGKTSCERAAGRLG
jgi:hypothetical protein